MFPRSLNPDTKRQVSFSAKDWDFVRAFLGKLMPRNPSTIVAYHLDLAVLSAVEGFAPDGNGIGTLFLSRYIERCFKEQELEFHGHGGFPAPLNSAKGWWEVSNLWQALSILRAALQELEILELSEIGWWCRDEGYWRGVYPANSSKDFGRHFGLDLDILCPRAAAEVEVMRAKLRAVTQYLQQGGES